MRGLDSSSGSGGVSVVLEGLLLVLEEIVNAGLLFIRGVTGSMDCSLTPELRAAREKRGSAVQRPQLQKPAVPAKSGANTVRSSTLSESRQFLSVESMWEKRPGWLLSLRPLAFQSAANCRVDRHVLGQLCTDQVSGCTDDECRLCSHGARRLFRGSP